MADKNDRKNMSSFLLSLSRRLISERVKKKIQRKIYSALEIDTLECVVTFVHAVRVVVAVVVGGWA